MLQNKKSSAATQPDGVKKEMGLWVAFISRFDLSPKMRNVKPFITINDKKAIKFSAKFPLCNLGTKGATENLNMPN